MGESPARWRGAAEAAQDSRGMESSSATLLSRSAELRLPAYPEPGELSYTLEKGWRSSEGCWGAGAHLGCPYPRRAEDGAELPPLLPPRNGQPKGGWGEPCEEPRWAEAVLAPLALYSHSYQRYHPLAAPGKARDAAGEPPASFQHCPFLVEAKHSPFLLSPAFEGPGPLGNGRFAGPEWSLGSYGPAWGQPLYLGVPPSCKAALPPFDGCSSSGNKEFYAKRGAGFHASGKNHAAPPLLGRSRAGPERAGEGEPELPGAPWGDGRAGGSSAVPPPHPRTPPPGSSRPLLLLQPGPWLRSRPPGAELSADAGPGRPSERRDAPKEPNPPAVLADGRYPAALAKAEPPSGCLCPTPRCHACPGVPFEPTSGRFPCPPSHHTKLKKTWLTRHSEQSLPRSKAPRWDGGPEPPGEGKRLAKRPHGPTEGPRSASEGAAAAKRGSKSAGDGEESRMELREEGPPSRRCLQTLPCPALPPGIPRCWACARRDPRGEEEEEEEEEERPESSCRLLHFRRFTLGDNGELSVDGLCGLGDTRGDVADPDGGDRNWGDRNWGVRNLGSSVCLAKHLLGVLGDAFCAAVRRDRDTWPGAPEGLTRWRRAEGAPQLCDRCQRGFFNSHWSCARCGFQLCPECHRGWREESGAEDPALPPECTPGREHRVSSLVPTQFVPTCVLTRLWKLLHELRAKFAIASRCPCAEGAAQQSPAEPPGTQEPPVPTVPAVPAEPARPVKEESAEEGAPPAPSGTLCELLASTAVKLCLGHDGVRMAFAPVAPALPSDNRLTSLLDSIIARVVERKLQERRAGPELSPPGPPEPPGPHSVLGPGGLLWLHRPGPGGAYGTFQEHWRHGRPVLVSGLQKRLQPRLWAPESFQPAGQDEEEEEEVKAVNLRAPRSRVRMSRRRFWDGFAASTAEREQGGGDLLKLERGFGDTELSRATNLRASLPLPEYCGAGGRLNLGSFLRGPRGRRWLRPRLCVSYAVPPQEQNLGTKPLTVEAADSISVLAHAVPAAREPLVPAELAELEAPLRERLGAGAVPGALWHIFRAEDAPRIRDFLRKVAQEPGQEVEEPPGTSLEPPGTSLEPPGFHLEPPGLYLDPSLRRRLRDECGVCGWSLLQLPGDAVLVPAGAPHQVRSLSGTISVEQRFLSPESAVRLRSLGAGTPRSLRAQLDGMILAAVREALGVLRGCQ